jgi:hypothetical protein
MSRLAIIAALGALLPTVAAAQTFEGAYLSVEAIRYVSEDDELGLNVYNGSSTLSFGGEFRLATAFGLSADFSNYAGDLRDNALTLHAFYRLNPGTALGGFYGIEQESYIDYGFSDSFEESVAENVSLSGSYYGVEGRTEIGRASAEAYIGQSEGDLIEGMMYGVTGRYDTGAIAFNARYLALDVGDVFDGRDRLSIGGEWTASRTTTVFVEVGRIVSTYYNSFNESEFDIRESFLSFGVRVGIGPNKGTTFGPRSFREIRF